MKKIFIPLLSTLLIFSCQSKKQVSGVEITMPKGIDIAMMDTLVSPENDFYNYANGGWMKVTEIPSDRGIWGSFHGLREYTDSISLDLLKSSIQTIDENDFEQNLVADLYASIMDTATSNSNSFSPIKENLLLIDGINNIEELQEYLIAQAPIGGNKFYDFYVRANMKNSLENAVYLGDASLGMNRDYYQKDDEDSNAKLLSYQKYLTRLFEYIGEKDAEIKAKSVVDFENIMADEMLTFEKLRDSDIKYNPMAVRDLSSLSSKIDLANYLEKIGVKTDSVIIPEINYYKNLDKFLNQDNLDAIKSYLKISLVNNNSSVLDQKLEQLSFDFYSKELKGIDEMRAKEKRALSTINGTIGQAFGKLYVDKYFPQEAKEKAEEMVRYIRKSFEKHIKEVSWMSDSTKIKALEKLKKFNVKIGFPDEWKDYSGLEFKSPEEGGTYFANMQNFRKWNFKEKMSKVGEKVDKSEWFMPPQMVNAYYSSQYNEIVFPAAILQPPFYNFQADAAVNFGGMGAVIGHEISHGFDDSGAKYDGDGNLNNWWTEEDKKAFETLGNQLAEQYNNYEVLPEIFVNGRATLGENIADLGGVNVAYDGLQMYLKDNGNPGEIDDLSPEKRFFISWATIWRTKSRDEALKNQVKSDFHSPGYFRAIGPLENVNAFHEAFNIKEGDKMFKPKSERIIIW